MARTLIAKKTLTMVTGEVSFIKGKEYFADNVFTQGLKEGTRVKDEEGTDHLLGSWVKHFKLIR